MLNDRGRVIGGLGALTCTSPKRQEKGAGLTVGRFQALCAEVKLCSAGRARAILALIATRATSAGAGASAGSSAAPAGTDGALDRAAPAEVDALLRGHGAGHAGRRAQGSGNPRPA